jgi:hypothetical protein
MEAIMDYWLIREDEMHGDMLFVVILVGMGMLGGIIIAGIAIMAKAISGRGANRREVQQLRGDISEIRSHIEDIKEQLADIIIRLG